MMQRSVETIDDQRNDDTEAFADEPAESVDLLLDRAKKLRLEGAYEEAAALFADLAQAVEEPVLLHQDFHHDNVLAAEREPWLAIDPKPLAGERAFDVPCLLRNRTADVFSAARPGEAMGRRLDFFADALAVDRERVRMWALAQAVELGLWDYEVGLADHGERLIECARLFRGL